MAPPLAFFVPAIALLFITTKAADGKVPYTYTGPTGPDQWGSLSPSYATCKEGKAQSPIDIVTKDVILNKDLKPLIRDYNPTNTSVLNTGVHVGLQYGANAGAFIENGKNYTLKQLHWHTPSEHVIDGVRCAAELHIVHSADDGSRAALALLYQLGAPDPLLNTFKKEIEQLGKDMSGTTQVNMGVRNLDQLERITRNRMYYRYPGSLTTPPCNQNVNWHILARVRSISREQVEALRLPLKPGCKDSARPLQPLNGRKVQKYQSS